MKCRSLGPRSPLAGWLWGLWSNWLPLGMLLCVQWSDEKEAQAESIFSFFVVVVAIFSLCPSLQTVPPPLCYPLNHPLYLSVWMLPVYLCPITLSGNNKVLPSLCFVIFSSCLVFPVFTDKTLPSVYICCSLHHILSVHLSPLLCFFVAAFHPCKPMLRDIILSHLQRYHLCWLHTPQWFFFIKDVCQFTVCLI